MKRTVLLFTLCSLLLASCNNSSNNNSNEFKINKKMEATKDQREGIETAIGYYMEGGRLANGNITAQAFTDNATMSWAENGKLVSVPIQVLYDFVNNSQAAPVSYEILSLSVQEDIAVANLKTQFGDAKYYDMFSFVKDGDEWKIVSKIYRNR